MRIRDEIRLGVGTLLAIQVLTMVAAVALLARMTPAIDRILEENEKSIRAVERMLLVLAEPPTSDPRADESRHLRFDRALAEAQGNITEPSEEPVLERIAATHEAALVGDTEALATVRAELWALGDINRESMLAANASAKRLGTAGAWALVFLGLIGLVFSIAMMRRARGKLIHPVYELGAVLDACNRGDVHRRFNPAGASREFQEVAEVVNALVAEHFAERDRAPEVARQLDRVALLRLLDDEPDATVVCDPSGAIAAANDAALERLGGSEGPSLREALTRSCAGEPDAAWSVEPLAELGQLCRLRAPAGAQGAGLGSAPSSLVPPLPVSGSAGEPVSASLTSPDSPGSAEPGSEAAGADEAGDPPVAAS